MFSEAVIEDEDEIVKGRRVNLMVFGCSERAGQENKLSVLFLLQRIFPYLFFHQYPALYPPSLLVSIAV